MTEIRLINVPLHEAEAAMKRAALDVQDERFEAIVQALDSLRTDLALQQPWTTRYRLADYFGVKHATVNEWIDRYGLPVERTLGHQKIISVEKLNAWMLPAEAQAAGAATSENTPPAMKESIALTNEDLQAFKKELISELRVELLAISLGDDVTVSEEEAAALLGIHHKTLARMRRAGEVTAGYIGKSPRYSLGMIRRMMRHVGAGGALGA